ncbi:MAG: dihydroorotate dehydrogenase [Coriobacteriia bacterium]|nr:dihydroorotate dehydrogenase [Coriobacteriia bacterium]
MSVKIGSLVMRNPVTVASGTFGSGKEYADFVDLGSLGAIVTKGVSAVPWTGNDGRRIIETASGMLNSIGLQNPGVEAFCSHDLTWLRVHAPQATIIVNVSGHTVDDYVEVIDRLESEPDVAAYEINISCPNVDKGGLAFGVSADQSFEVTAACRARTTRPIIMKLTPNVTDIAEIACACEHAGADGVSLINTVLATSLDIERRVFRVERKVAGLSGPAIKPIALRMVYAASQAIGIPVIGMGGIACPDDAIEFMLAGANAVAIGTGNFLDPTLTTQCIERIESYGRAQGFDRASDLTSALKG